MPSIPAKAPILANQNMDSSTLLKILSSLSKIIDLLAKKDSWSTEAIIGLVAVFVSVAIALIGYFRGLDCFKRNLSKLCDLSAILWNKTLVRRNKKAKKPETPDSSPIEPWGPDLESQLPIPPRVSLEQQASGSQASLRRPHTSVETASPSAPAPPNDLESQSRSQQKDETVLRRVVGILQRSPTSEFRPFIPQAHMFIMGHRSHFDSWGEPELPCVGPRIGTF
ncbi:uncharacterized protein BKA78DRAFT_304974 [Phyllosticta capitalensis]|uniref:uncharacterized protein n=1 Tax=Phyllosticta capitalensis TaxID=121624 RepID=UPI00312F16B8